MKKTALFVFLLALAAGGILFAQKTTASTTAISGTLGLSGGNISVQSGNVTYYVMRLDRFIGFIDGLKYGAQISLEGYASNPAEGQTERLFYPVKLTLNGKDYEVGSAIPGHSEGQPNRQDRAFPAPNSPMSGRPPRPDSQRRTPPGSDRQLFHPGTPGAPPGR